MGNCQAAEAATVVIQHPGTGGNKVERIYWSVRAHEVMASNPGHYVALVIGSTASRTENGVPVKQLKLLRPDDALLLGHVYRLVSVQEVVKEFAAKKCAKLGKLLKESGGFVPDINYTSSRLPPGFKPTFVNPSSQQKGAEVKTQGGNRGGRTGTTRGAGRQHGGGGPWKPALNSIAEIGN